MPRPILLSYARMRDFRVLSLITPVSYRRIKGVSRFADANGWSLTIHDRLFGRQPATTYDGVIVALRENEDAIRYVRAIRRKRIPVVDITIEHPEIRIPRVISDHRDIGLQAGRHFTEHGFASAAWFSTRWSHVHKLRYEGLCEACRARSHSATVEKFVSCDERETRRWAVSLRKPIAVLTYDETDAQLFLNICLDAQIAVPDEIAILAIGDDPIVTGHQAVPLSCIKLNPERNGYAAAALLDRLMRGGPAPSAPIMIKPDGITVRQSTDTYANTNPVVRKALLYIRDNMNRPFGVEQIAEALGESRSRIDKICAARLGHSLGKEILLRRLAEARRLLENTDLQVAQIAAACGFCSSAYFVERFRAAIGLTPRRWRIAHTLGPTSHRQITQH